MPRPVQGPLIRWARVQLDLTLQDVTQRAGIAKGYQCEVERNLDPGDHAKKSRVSQKKLDPWLQCLGVTEEFAVGAMPKYHEQPAQCRGLALDVGLAIRAENEGLSAWQDLPAPERARRLLERIARESVRLPKVVLAYVLGVEVRTLEAFLNGEYDVPGEIVEALPVLTLLPREFLHAGTLERDVTPYQSYLPVLDFAIEHQITPDQVRQALQGLIDGDQPPESRPRPHP